MTQRYERRPVQVVVTPQGRVVRYKRDSVGNDLTTALRWCATHHEPLWVFSDGSFTCPYDRVTEIHSDDHVVVDAPWENR